ncbi:MAG: S-layer homology domain-containing protein, partial [Bacillota bacterium]
NLAVIVDSQGKLAESDETNNVTMMSITVAAPAEEEPQPQPQPEPQPEPAPEPEPQPAQAPVPACTEALFADVPADHPACGAIKLLVEQGIVAGYPDGTFQPTKSVTRAEFAKLFVLTMGAAPQANKGLAFFTTGHWAANQGYLQAAVSLGTLAGFPDGTFKPNDPVTRAQGVKIAISGLPGASGSPEPAGLYHDIAANAWYRSHVAAALNEGLIGSAATFPVFTGAAFSGDTPLTRAEAALLLANLLLQK